MEGFAATNTSHDTHTQTVHCQGCVDELARDLYTAGLIQDKCESEGFYTRLTAIERQFPHASVLLHKRGILPQAIADLWANPKLLDVRSTRVVCTCIRTFASLTHQLM